MATRPVFLSTTSGPLWKETTVDFQWFPGFSEGQKRRSIESLHDSFISTHPEKTVLEISCLSESELGRSLSTFNLKLQRGDKTVTVEAAFQGLKVFELGGLYTDAYKFEAKDAKGSPAFGPSSPLAGLELFNQGFPLEPKTFFYDWVYINALAEKQTKLDFDAFTDIAFNPKNSLNCQARSAAIYVSLTKRGLLGQALQSPLEFKKIVYSELKSA